MTKPLVAVTALLVGSAVTGIILVLIKKKITAEEYENVAVVEEEELDLSQFNIEG